MKQQIWDVAALRVTSTQTEAFEFPTVVVLSQAEI